MMHSVLGVAVVHNHSVDTESLAGTEAGTVVVAATAATAGVVEGRPTWALGGRNELVAEGSLVGRTEPLRKSEAAHTGSDSAAQYT